MVNQEQVLEILHAVGEKISEEKLYLTELDNVIGDGDHGINLARGFAEVEKKRPMMEGKDIGTMLKTTGMALVSTVGGASGPLYGTAFMQAGQGPCRKDGTGCAGSGHDPGRVRRGRAAARQVRGRRKDDAGCHDPRA